MIGAYAAGRPNKLFFLTVRHVTSQLSQFCLVGGVISFENKFIVLV